METEPTDRRVQRTRDLLRRALIELIMEKGYDAITIQDITERANLGRTTFYLHYQSKDDLFLDHHEGLANGFYLGMFSRDEFLADQPPTLLVHFLEQINSNRHLYFKIVGAKDIFGLLEGIRQQVATNLETSLQAAFPEANSEISFHFLAHYIAGAQVSFVNWWLENRNQYTADETAYRLHKLQRAAILIAVNIDSDSQ